MNVLLSIACILFLLLSILHVYWAFGGRWGFNASIPLDSNGRKTIKPGIFSTFIVAIGLGLFSYVDFLFLSLASANFNISLLRYALLFIAIIFLLRAIGDFKYIGFFKRFRKTSFAKRDSMLYTPLCSFLSFTHFAVYFFGDLA